MTLTMATRSTLLGAALALTSCERAAPRPALDADPTPAPSAVAARTAVPRMRPAQPAAKSGTASASRPSACRTPESLAAVALVDDAAFAPAELEGVRAARAELRRVLLSPAEFRASAALAGDLVLIDLWHHSAFEEPACRAAASADGKSRTLTYDRRLRRIVSAKVWTAE